LLDGAELSVFVDSGLERIRQHLTEEEIQAGLAHGAGIDLRTVAEGLLKVGAT
jgi:hypothetical protein